MTASLRELGLEGDGQVGMVQEHSMSVAFHNRDDFPPKLPVEEMGSRQKIQQTQPGKQKLHLPPIGGSGPSPEKQSSFHLGSDTP